MPTIPPGFRCEECWRIARVLRDAWQADNRLLRAKLRDVAAASGRDARQLGVVWISSIAAMPDDEIAVLLDSHYPNVARAKQQRDDHNLATGHVVPLHAGWTLSAYRGEEAD